MSIAKALLTDIYQMNKLVNSAYRGEDSKKGWTTEADLLDGVRTDEDGLSGLITKPGAVFLKYTRDENILQGCVYLEKQNNKMHLGMLSVLPGEQAKGIGKKLLSEAEKYSTDQQCSIIEITVISVRNELIAWYEKNGYVRTGNSKPFPGDNKFGVPKMPLEFIVMQKKI
jgi:ribosomal protein S18 acetylase RimI-like enzyme